MKLKRFLAFIVAFAMVMSVMPAMSLTVSAAEMSDEALLEYAKTTTALFDSTNPAPTATNDTAIATAWPNSGWSGGNGNTAVDNGSLLNVAGSISAPRIQAYANYTGNGTKNSVTVDVPDYASGKDWVLFSFYPEYTCFWGDVVLHDINGNHIAGMRYGTNGNKFNVRWGHDGWNNPFGINMANVSVAYLDTTNMQTESDGSYSCTVASGSNLVEILIRNYDPDGIAVSGDEYYTSTYFVDGTAKVQVKYNNGTKFNGLGDIGMNRGSDGGKDYNRISVLKPSVYAGNYPATSDASTIAAALNDLKIDTMSKGATITLPSEATDILGTKVDVTWTSSNTSVVSNSGDVTQTDKVETVTLTPSTTFDNATVTGSAKTVTVFPKALAGATNYLVGDINYNVGTTNLIGANWDFSEGYSAWYDGTGTIINSAGFDIVNVNDVYYADTNYDTSGNNNGGGSPRALKRKIAGLEAGKKYLLAMTGKNISDEWAKIVINGTEANYIFSQGANWERQTYVFTSTTDNIEFAYRWCDGYYESFELYELTLPETSREITVKYSVEGNVIDSFTQEITYDTTVYPNGYPLSAVYYSENGSNVGYEAAVQNATESKTIAMTKVTKNADVASLSNGKSFTWREITGTIASNNFIPNGDFANGIYGWYNAAGGVMENAIVNDDGTITTKAGGGSSDAKTLQRSWPIEAGKTYVFTYYNNQASAKDIKWQRVSLSNDFKTNNKAMVIGAGDNDRETGFAAATGQNTVVFTNTEGYKYVNFVAAWSGNITFDNFGLYEVTGMTKNYTVTIEGVASGTEGLSEYPKTVTALSVEDVEIPYFKGHIFDSRDVSGTNITYTYATTVDNANTLGAWAIRNNVTGGTWVTQMKFLGAHNAFANKSTAFVNEGGKLYADNGGDVNYPDTTSSTVVKRSQTQDATVLEMLNWGVRYFDIRLSRQKDGSFVAVHGPAFSEFRPIAETIAQWAEENPGEIILLDFQTTYDALYDNSNYNVVTTEASGVDLYGDAAGDDNYYVYSELQALLIETGLMNYRPNEWDKNYDVLTNNGTRTSVLLIGKVRFAEGYDTIISRGAAGDGAGGHTTGNTTYLNTSRYNGNILGDGVVDKINDNYSNLSPGAKIGIIHAYTTTLTSALLTEAETNNSKWKDEANFAGWMGRDNGDVLLMDGITEEVASTYLAILSQYNRDGYDENYGNETDVDKANCTTISSNGVVMTGALANVPDYATEFRATPTATTNTYTIGTNKYTAKTKYNVQLLQYDVDSKNIAGEMTLTFPNPVTSDLEKAVLLNASGTEVLAEAQKGETLSASVNSLGEYIVAIIPANGIYVTVKYVEGDTAVYTEPEKYVPYNTVVYTVPEGDFYIKNSEGTDAYILNSETASSETVTSDHGALDDHIVFEVPVTLVSEYATIGDTFANKYSGVGDDGKVDCNNTSNMIYITSANDSANGNSDAADTDADGVATYTGTVANASAPRIPLVMFKKPTLDKNQAVKLHLYVAEKVQENTVAGATMKLAANTVDITVDDENVGHHSKDVANVEGIVWSDNTFTVGTAGWVEIDVTEFVKAATGDTVTFTLYTPAAGAYIVDREKAVAGGTYEGKAAYLTIEDAAVVTAGEGANLTKNGTAFETAYVTEGDSVRVYTEDGFVAVTDGTTEYESGAVVEVTGNAEFIGIPDRGDNDFIGSGTEDDPYKIYNLADLKRMRDFVNADNETYNAAHYILMNDIDLSDVNDDNTGWEPIGSYHSKYEEQQHYFKGTFDGNYHTISGMHMIPHEEAWDYTGHYEGLFGYVHNATIKNLTISGANLISCDYSGLVAAAAYGKCTFENINIKNSEIYVYNCSSAGILGFATGVDGEGNESQITFTNINVDETNKIGALWDTYDSPVGGILGYAYKNCDITMTNCNVAAQLDVFNDVASNYQWWQYRRAGMLIGFLGDDTNHNTAEGSDTFVVSSKNITAKFVDCGVIYGDWNQYEYCEWKAAGKPSYAQYDEWKFRRTDKLDPHELNDHEEDVKEYHEVLIVFNQLWTQGNYYTGFNPTREFAGVTIFDKNEDVVKNTISGKTYTTLQEALDEAMPGDVLILLKNVETNETLSVYDNSVAMFALVAEETGSEPVTLNLMGNTITGVSDEEDFTLIENNGNLVIKDNIGTGALKTTGSNSTVIKNNAGSNLTLNGGDVEGANGVVLDAAEGNGGSLTVTGKSSVTGGVRLLGATSEEESSVTLSLADNSVDEVVYDKPELPTATVAELDNDNLTFALNFKADEVTAEQLEYYGSWYADYVIKVNKDIDLNANGGADGYLSGQYDAWSENWVNVPFEKVTLKANEGLKIMEYASELMGKPGLKYTYKEVYEKVKDFDCGIFLEPAFIAANPDLEITLELRMYNNEDETESYTIGETYVFTIPALPTATVTEIDNDELTFALNFKADEVTEKQLNFYDNWYADYVLKINKDVTFNAAGGADGYLSGQYDAWSENWVNVPLEDVTLKADEELKIMEYASAMLGKPGLKVTYNDVYKSVKDFDCGVFFTSEFITANPDLKVTLELRMYNPADETVSYVIGRTYVFEPENVATIGEVGYKTLQAAFNAVAESGAEEIATITLCADTEEKVEVADGVLAKLVTGGKSTGTFELGADVLLTADANLTVTGEGLVAGKDSEGTKFGYTTMPLGLTMVQGAQVRVGDGVNEKGEVNGTDSGLRFITKVNTSDTLVSTDDNAEMGVVITAQGSTAKAKIKTEKWQEEGKLFTSALKNLAVGNFYRKFTATPYVVVDGIEFVNNDEANKVTRSIYQVAAGLLVKGNPEGDAGYEDEDALKEGEKLYAVLNAYVNQTGIRLVAVDGELKVNTNLTASGAYGLGADELHFAVTNASYDVQNNVYKVTIEALGNAEIYTEGFLLNYIRINNNNSKVKEKVTVKAVDSKTVELTFNAEGLLDRFESDNTTPDIGGEGFDPETQN